jgi:hypothetical protein
MQLRLATNSLTGNWKPGGRDPIRTSRLNPYPAGYFSKEIEKDI